MLVAVPGVYVPCLALVGRNRVIVLKTHRMCSLESSQVLRGWRDRFVIIMVGYFFHMVMAFFEGAILAWILSIPRT